MDVVCVLPCPQQQKRAMGSNFGEKKEKKRKRKKIDAFFTVLFSLPFPLLLPSRVICSRDGFPSQPDQPRISRLVSAATFCSFHNCLEGRKTQAQNPPPRIIHPRHTTTTTHTPKSCFWVCLTCDRFSFSPLTFPLVNLWLQYLSQYYRLLSFLCSLADDFSREMSPLVNFASINQQPST